MSTLTVRYIGPHPAVEVPLPGGGEATVANGDTLETTTEHGESLLEQPSNWSLPTAAKPARRRSAKHEEPAQPAAGASTPAAGEGGDDQ